jgi:hypothetical protein
LVIDRNKSYVIGEWPGIDDDRIIDLVDAAGFVYMPAKHKVGFADLNELSHRLAADV